MSRDLSYPLHWPAGWPRSRSTKAAGFNRKVSNGRYMETREVTVSVAMDRLQSQLDMLGARGVILSSNLERNLNGSPKSGKGEPVDTGVAVYFVLKGKDTVLACDKWNRTADNIVAISKHIEALRGIDRWGVGSLEQAFAGYQALPAPEQWWEVLQCPRTATKGQIEAAYRELAKNAHPDKPGGSTAAMARLNAARDAGTAQL